MSKTKSTANLPGPKIPALTFDAQLAWLETQVRQEKFQDPAYANGAKLRMLLSLAESVKAAQERSSQEHDRLAAAKLATDREALLARGNAGANEMAALGIPPTFISFPAAERIYQAMREAKP